MKHRDNAAEMLFGVCCVALSNIVLLRGIIFITRWTQNTE